MREIEGGTLRRRDEIEEEIRRRQENWQNDEAKKPHETPPGSSDEPKNAMEMWHKEMSDFLNKHNLDPWGRPRTKNQPPPKKQ